MNTFNDLRKGMSFRFRNHEYTVWRIEPCSTEPANVHILLNGGSMWCISRDESCLIK